MGVPFVSDEYFKVKKGKVKNGEVEEALARKAVQRNAEFVFVASSQKENR